MKKILLLFVAALMMSCQINSEPQVSQPDSRKSIALKRDIFIVEIDSCEYIIFSRATGYCGIGGIIHKENCKYCAERKNKSK